MSRRHLRLVINQADAVAKHRASQSCPNIFDFDKAHPGMVDWDGWGGMYAEMLRLEEQGIVVRDPASRSGFKPALLVPTLAERVRAARK